MHSKEHGLKLNRWKSIGGWVFLYKHRRSFLCIAQVSVRDIDVCEYSQQTLQQQLPKNWLNEVPC